MGDHHDFEAAKIIVRKFNSQKLPSTTSLWKDFKTPLKEHSRATFKVGWRE
jgi:hypothetical protein